MGAVREAGHQVPSLVFMGSKTAGLRALRRLVEGSATGVVRAVVCADDSADPRSVLGAFRDYADEHGLPLHVVGTRADTIELLRRLEPAGVVLHGWYQLLPVSQFPSTRFFNFHYSPLPRYRGHAPLVWQIMNGERELAVSFFVLTDGMDDGDLVDQQRFTLAVDEDISHALDKADALVGGMLDRFVRHWADGDVPCRPQSSATPSYGGLRTPADGRVDWTQPADVVHDFVRAQAPPYPGAFAQVVGGPRITLLRTSVEERTFFGHPGAVVEVGPRVAVVACGRGAVRVESVAREDGLGVDASAVLRSVRQRLV